MESYFISVDRNLKEIYKRFELEILKTLKIRPLFLKSYITFKVRNKTLVNFEILEGQINIHLHTAKGNFDDGKNLFEDVSGKNYSRQVNKVKFESQEAVPEETFKYILEKIYETYEREIQ